MKDSTDKNNELDQYGVWVKTPPRSTQEAPDAPHSPSGSIDDTLPDFSFLDTPVEHSPASGKNSFEAEDTSLTPDELSHITGSVEQPSAAASEAKAPDETAPSAGEEEISLDDFITGGFSDAPAEEAKPVEAPEAATPAETDVSLDDFLGSGTTSPAATSDGDVSLDSFLGTGAPSKNDEVSLDDFMGPSSTRPEEAKPAEIADEKPMDIDLSFDDSLDLPEENPAAEEQQAPAEAASTEEVDLSSFDTATDAATAKASATNVDLDNFDSVFDTIVDEGDAPSPDASASVPNAATAADGTENVNLSDFGIDPDSGEQNVVLPNATAEKPKESTDYAMDVTTDEETVAPEPVDESSSDEMKEESVVIEAQPEAATSAPASPNDSSSFGAPSEDDFDVDSILNSVKDEQGKTVCVGKTADALSKEVESVPLEEAAPAPVESETIEDLNQSSAANVSEGNPTETISETIPDTFEEETAFLADTTKEAAEPQQSPSMDIPEYLPDDIASSIDLDKEGEIPPAAEDATTTTAAAASVEEAAPAVAEEPPVAEAAASTAAPTTEKQVPQESSSELDDENHEILKQIAGELNALKDEISGLKLEFADLKKSSAVSAEITPAAHQDEKSEGFFSGTDEDETIALSGDELDNILNNADFTSVQPAEAAPAVEEAAPAVEEAAPAVEEAAPAVEEAAPAVEEAAPIADEPAPAPSSQSTVTDDAIILGSADVDIPEQDDYDNAPTNLKMDFSNEKLEEPVFDTVDFGSAVVDDTTDASKTLPDEISIPKVDDVLVESSNTDLMDTEVTTAGTPSTQEQPAEELPEDIEEVAPAEEIPSAEELPPAKAEILPADSISKPIDLFKEEEPSPLTEDKINYLSEDNKVAEPTEESGISEEPVDSVFSQWNAPAEAIPVVDETAAPEPTVLEKEPEAVAADATPAKPADDASIPSDMKQEIKSVLSYMDQLLENLPEDKITEFAQSEQFETYKKLFVELGLA